MRMKEKLIWLQWWQIYVLKDRCVCVILFHLSNWCYPISFIYKGLQKYSFMEQGPSCQEIPHLFVEPRGSLLCSQEPASCPYPEPDQSSLHLPTISPTSILILSSHLCLVLLSSLFLSVFPTKFFYTFTSLLCVLHALPISSSLICYPNNIWWSVQVMKILIM